MRIGTIKENKDNENRVGLTPDAVRALKKDGHELFVESGAGVVAGYSTSEYERAGATICNTPKEVVKNVDLLVKVKEPIELEIVGPNEWLSSLKGKALLTFLHLSANRPLAEKLLEYKITGISYDTLENEKGELFLLKPMSEIAGRMAADLALEKNRDREALKAVVLGGGVVGQSAVTRLVDEAFYSAIHSTHSAPHYLDITVLENSIEKKEEVREKLSKAFLSLQEKHRTRADFPMMTESSPSNPFFLNPNFVEFLPWTQISINTCANKSETEEFQAKLKAADVVIGAVLVKGAKAPHVLGAKEVGLIKDGALIIDVAIDQGGCIFGSYPTSYTNPTYTLFKKTYCCIPNLPGKDPYEASVALSNGTLPIIKKMAKEGFHEFFLNEKTSNAGYCRGLNTYDGKIVNETISADLGLTTACP